MKLVIFDLDGVIVSTDDYHYEAWKELAIRYSLMFNRAINENLRGVSRADSLKIILDYNHISFSTIEFEQMLSTKNEIYREKLKNLNTSHILPGVLELLQSIRSFGCKIAIGSSSKNAPFILEQIGLADKFDAIVDGNMITNSKPDPEVFMKGANSLNVDYKECIVFEDAEAGIEAAKRCNMKTVGVGNITLGADLHYSTLENIVFSEVLKAFEAE